MGTTKIEWTDKVWNPITGCEPISEGCDHCYAKRFSQRFWGDQYVAELKGYKQASRRRRFSDVQCHEERLDEPLHWRKPRRIMVPSMGDLFHRHVPLEFVWRVWQVMIRCPQHAFMVLTKRPKRAISVMKEMAPSGGWWSGTVSPNIWVGVTAENQDRWNERVPLLLQIPAAIRFVSIEPCLSLIHMDNGIGLNDWSAHTIDWIICGGETGSGARPMNPTWARHIRNQCRDADKAFFFKQMGSGRATPKDLEIREWPA